MRIAQLSPVVERVPPKKYGGTERVIWALTEELVRRGHDVTLFASGDSQTSAQLRSPYPRGLREARMKDLYTLNYYTLLNIGSCYDAQNEFDIIHDHLAPISLPTAQMASTPIVTTAHGPFTADNYKLFRALRRPAVVTISEAQIHGMRDIHHAGVVYNGLPMEDYPFGEQAGDYLLSVGRISIEKGTHEAIIAAQELDMPLI
ncbi:MAG: glycosyltransferase, partial [Minisyncoccia bacterium]